MLASIRKIRLAFASRFRSPPPLGESTGEGGEPDSNQALLLAGSLCIIFLCLLFNQSHSEAQELRRIPYGTTASPSHLPVWVAKDAGLFEKAGLNVEPVQIRGGSLITLAIITGNLPFSGAGAESVVAARASGGDVILLACPVDADPRLFNHPAGD